MIASVSSTITDPAMAAAIVALSGAVAVLWRVVLRNLRKIEGELGTTREALKKCERHRIVLEKLVTWLCAKAGPEVAEEAEDLKREWYIEAGGGT